MAALVTLAACARGDARKGADLGDVGKAHVARVPRDPATVRREGNALAASSSSYLREHAHDPVDWRPWGDDALALAIAENKPIFLSIGYSACHFCHVMHDEVFAKDDVARVLNEHFISIKVDREERPDLDVTYMAALSRFSGSTGWPATLFLTPSLDPFFGATYVKHDRFLEVATRATEAFANREAGALSPLPIHDVLTDGALVSGTRLGEDELRALAADAASAMDPLRGGFGGGAKFPMAPRLSFLLHATRKWDMPELDSRLRTTLFAIAHGALRDPISGAFHRYTTDAGWATPHYEVMLYDVAQLATLYFEVAAATGEREFGLLARETLDFLLRDMRTEGGAFAASIDADSAGEEGAAFRWSSAEITAVVGGDGPLVAKLLGVGDAKVAPSRRVSVADVAKGAHVAEQDVEAAWARARPLLAKARAATVRRDGKVVTAWNGLTIRALCMGFAATREPSYRDAAVAAGTWVAAHARDDHGNFARTPGGAPAFAADHGDLASGYLALFEATADLVWLTRADEQIREGLTLEAPGGGFYEGRGELAREVSLDDGVEPSGTAALLAALLRRNALSASDAWAAPVARTLVKYGNTLRARKLDASAWLDAALTDVGPTYELVVAGSASDAAPLLEVSRALLPSWATLSLVPADGADPTLRAALPSLEGKLAPPGGTRARAFVCERTACKSPTSDPRVLREQLLAGWRR